MNPTELRQARRQLKLTQSGLASALGMTGKHSARTVRLWEREGSSVPGPVSVAVKLLVDNALRAKMGEE